MKCSYEVECEGNAFTIYTEEMTPRWEMHYLKLVSGQEDLCENYTKVDTIINDIEDALIKFQNILINVKAIIAIFKSNKTALENVKMFLDEISNAEKHLEFQILKIMDHATKNMRPESYHTYLAIK